MKRQSLTGMKKCLKITFPGRFNYGVSEARHYKRAWCSMSVFNVSASLLRGAINDIIGNTEQNKLNYCGKREDYFQFTSEENKSFVLFAEKILIIERISGYWLMKSNKSIKLLQVQNNIRSTSWNPLISCSVFAAILQYGFPLLSVENLQLPKQTTNIMRQVPSISIFIKQLKMHKHYKL